MNKPTPGPWVCHLGQSDDMPDTTCRCRSILGGEYAGGIGQVFEDNGKKVSEGGNDCPPQAEARANARLIAAAPDMLNELEVQLAFLLNVVPLPEMHQRVVQLQATIALARGRS